MRVTGPDVVILSDDLAGMGAEIVLSGDSGHGRRPSSDLLDQACCKTDNC